MQGRSNKKVYRDAPATLVLGAFGVLFAGWQSSEPLMHLLSGTPMMLSNGRTVGAGQHASTPSDLWFLVCCWGLFGMLGLYLVLSWINSCIVIDDDEIVGKNILGLVVLRAPWRAVDRVERLSSSFSRVDKYVLYANSQRISFKSTFPNGDELVQAVRRHCPHVDTTPWR
jgi:hypothetical protein